MDGWPRGEWQFVISVALTALIPLIDFMFMHTYVITVMKDRIFSCGSWP